MKLNIACMHVVRFELMFYHHILMISMSHTKKEKPRTKPNGTKWAAKCDIIWSFNQHKHCVWFFLPKNLSWHIFMLSFRIIIFHLVRIQHNHSRYRWICRSYIHITIFIYFYVHAWCASVTFYKSITRHYFVYCVHVHAFHVLVFGTHCSLWLLLLLSLSSLYFFFAFYVHHTLLLCVIENFFGEEIHFMCQ